MPGKCSYQEHWLEEQKNWKLWLRSVDNDKSKAYCCLCKTKFDVGYSGIASVKIHEKGKKHAKYIAGLVNCTTLSGFKPSEPVKPSLPVPAPKESDSSSFPDGSPSTSAECVGLHDNLSASSRPTTLSKYLINDEVTKAEIIWALNKVVSHSSDRSSGRTSDLFPVMFSDSVIAKKFQMQKDKLSYVVTYGLGPFFQNSLAEDVKKCSFFAVSFDESLNKISQRGQMDIVVRYWNDHSNTVSTRYLTSAFLQHATANDLVDGFTKGISGLGLSVKNIIQIAMDGPNVNIKFLRDIKELLKDDLDANQPEMFDVGTCSLHIVHGAYKTAHNKSGWLMHEFLRSLFYLFKDYPSRRADYTHYSGSVLFPRKFCAIRWVENSKVLERAHEIIPFVKKYVEGVNKKPPKTNNFAKVSHALSDKLLPAKLQFMQSVALQLEPFLTTFQSNDSLLPIMYKELYILLRGIAERFLQKRVMSNVNNATKLMSINVSDPSNLLVFKTNRDIDIGFGAATACRGLKELEITSFKKQCREFLVVLFTKLSEKCPLKSKIVKGASCLSPDVMASDTLRASRVSLALGEFVSNKHMIASVADCVKRDYNRLCEIHSVKENLKTFDFKKDKLDAFLHHIAVSNHAHKDTIKFFHQILVMFHGNAAVERGFSINKECLVENLQQESLIAQRTVYDAVSSIEKLSDFTVTKPMILAARNASCKRKEALKAKKAEEDEHATEKKKATQDLKALELKKKRILVQTTDEVSELNKEIENLKKKIRK